MIECGRKAVEIAAWCLQAAGHVKLLRRVAVFHDQHRRHGAGPAAGITTGGAKVDQDRIAVCFDHDVVWRNIAVQQISHVDRLDSVEQLQQHIFHAIGRKRCIVRLHDVVQIKPVDQIKHHIGGFVFFECAVHADDVLVAQLCKAAGLSHKHRDGRTEMFLIGLVAGDDALAAAQTEVIGKALFDHDRPAKDVILCAVRDTKTTGADTFDYCELIT